MADIQFDLVSPERSLASMPAATVQIPGAEGDMTIMADHAPTITTLRPGVVRVDASGTAHEFVVTGGFAQVSPQGISVLAERAVASAEMSQDVMDEIFAEAQDAYTRTKAAEGAVDDAAKLLADLAAVGASMGLSTKAPEL